MYDPSEKRKVFEQFKPFATGVIDTFHNVVKLKIDRSLKGSHFTLCIYFPFYEEFLKMK